MLDAPGRLWPWFSLGWAAMGGLVLIFIGRGGPTTTVLEAVFAWLLAGGMLLYAGWKVDPLGYDALKWVCWGVGIALTVNVVVQGLVFLVTRKGKS